MPENAPSKFQEGKFFPFSFLQEVVDLIRANVSHKDADFILQNIKTLPNIRVPLNSYPNNDASDETKKATS